MDGLRTSKNRASVRVLAFVSCRTKRKEKMFPLISEDSRPA